MFVVLVIIFLLVQYACRRGSRRLVQVPRPRLIDYAYMICGIYVFKVAIFRHTTFPGVHMKACMLVCMYEPAKVPDYFAVCLHKLCHAPSPFACDNIRLCEVRLNCL